MCVLVWYNRNSIIKRLIIGNLLKRNFEAEVFNSYHVVHTQPFVGRKYSTHIHSIKARSDLELSIESICLHQIILLLRSIASLSLHVVMAIPFPRDRFWKSISKSFLFQHLLLGDVHRSPSLLTCYNNDFGWWEIKWKYGDIYSNHLNWILRKSLNHFFFFVGKVGSLVLDTVVDSVNLAIMDPIVGVIRYWCYC